MNETASRACCGRSTRGTMIPWAPRSSARPMRRRSPDWGRTRAAVVVAPTAWRFASSSDSVPAPCSRSMISQSKPARATSSVATGEPSPANVPKSVSPAWSRGWRSMTPGTGGSAVASVMADMMRGRVGRRSPSRARPPPPARRASGDHNGHIRRQSRASWSSHARVRQDSDRPGPIRPPDARQRQSDGRRCPEWSWGAQTVPDRHRTPGQTARRRVCQAHTVNPGLRTIDPLAT